MHSNFAASGDSATCALEELPDGKRLKNIPTTDAESNEKKKIVAVMED